MTCRLGNFGILADQERTDIVKSEARLSFVDRALVLDEHGALLGAGTMIRTEQTLDFDVLIFSMLLPMPHPFAAHFRASVEEQRIVQLSFSVVQPRGALWSFLTMMACL